MTNEIEIQIAETKIDPNNIEKMETGAQRSGQLGRGPFNLIPTEATRRVAIKYEHGANGYGENNWKNGFKFSRLMNSAMHHLNQYLDGDRSEDHLAASVWNINAMMHFEKYKQK